MRNKKKIYICNDSFGSRINVGDTVELMMGVEMSTSWTSRVYWNMLDGAFVDAHPGHRKMGLGVHRRLRDFLGKEDIEVNVIGGGTEMMKTYCKKIKNTRV